MDKVEIRDVFKDAGFFEEMVTETLKDAWDEYASGNKAKAVDLLEKIEENGGSSKHEEAALFYALNALTGKLSALTGKSKTDVVENALRDLLRAVDALEGEDKLEKARACRKAYEMIEYSLLP